MTSLSSLAASAGASAITIANPLINVAESVFNQPCIQSYARVEVKIHVTAIKSCLSPKNSICVTFDLLTSGGTMVRRCAS